MHQQLSERSSAPGPSLARGLSLAVFVVVALVARAPFAQTKGGVQAVANATSPAAVELKWASEFGSLKMTKLGTKQICNGADPTKAQCQSAAFAKTTCGKFEKSRIEQGYSSSCSTLCPTPTTVQCQSQPFWSSLCGVVEAQKRAQPFAPGCTDENPGTPCPPHPTSRCADKLYAELYSAMDDSLTILPDAPLRDTLVAVSLAPSSTAADDVTAIVANGFADPSERRTVRHLEPSLSGFRSQGTSVHYWGRMLDDHVVFLPDVGALAPAALVQRRESWQGNRDEWEGNDNPPTYAMNSCAEYVYEKYYDYSLFEDMTREAGADYRQFVDVAYGAAGLPSSIGTRAINGTDLRSKNGDTLPVELQFDARPRPKNAFFLPAGSYAEGADRSEAIALWQSQGNAIKIDVAGEVRFIPISRPLAVRLAFAGGANEVGFGIALDFVLVDEQVLPAGQQQLTPLLAPHPMISESFAYHQQKAVAFPSTRDEELYAYDRMKREFESLWHERTALAGRIMLMLTSTTDLPTETNNVPWDPTIFENPASFLDIWEQVQNPIGEIINTQRDFENVRTKTFGVDVGAEQVLGGMGVVSKLGGTAIAGNIGGGAPGALNLDEGKSFNRSMEFMSDLSLGGGDVATGGVEFLEEANAVDYADELTRLIRQLADLDDRIQRELQRARSLGCLSSSPSNPCDWSPRSFAESISGQLMAVREKDFQSCLAATADDFAGQEIDVYVTDRFVVDIDGAEDDALACVDGLAAPCVEGVVCDDPPYNTSPSLLERFPKCRDAYHAMYLRAITALLNGAGGIIDPATGEVAPYESSSDSERIGDDLFGVGYAYGARWQLSNLPPEGSDDDNGRWCDVEPTVSGNFDVEATVLGADFTLVKAGFETGLGPDAVHRASLEVVGESFIDVGPTEAAMNPNTFNVVFQETESRFDSYFSASATFMVGPVPVKIAGGVAGILGVVATGRVGSPPGSGGCQSGTLAVEAEFSPFYGINAFATASVDAVVVEVGVKISIDIVTVSFPIKAGVRLEGLGDNDTKLSVTNDVDLVFSILGGRISAFVEVCVIFCEEIDVTLWRWAPTRFASNLFHSAIEFRLGPLVENQSEIAAMPQ